MGKTRRKPVELRFTETSPGGAEAAAFARNALLRELGDALAPGEGDGGAAAGATPASPTAEGEGHSSSPTGAEEVGDAVEECFEPSHAQQPGAGEGGRESEHGRRLLRAGT
jgi:hypothetical protein